MAAVNSGGGELRIETDSVLDAVSEFRTIADDLREGLRQLVSSAEEVIDGSWRGAAATAFSSEWSEFRDAAHAIVEDAEVIADLVAISVTQYAGSDADSAAMLKATWAGA